MRPSDFEVKIKLSSRPLIIHPCIANAVGLTEAVVLQQIHYWMDMNESKAQTYKDGCFWTFNTIQEWEKQFPFISIATIKRCFTKLEDQKVIRRAHFHTNKWDRTTWYTIDYEELTKVIAAAELSISSKRANGVAQDEPITEVKVSQSNTETTTETTEGEYVDSIPFYLNTLETDAHVREAATLLDDFTKTFIFFNSKKCSLTIKIPNNLPLELFSLQRVKEYTHGQLNDLLGPLNAFRMYPLFNDYYQLVDDRRMELGLEESRRLGMGETKQPTKEEIDLYGLNQ